MKSYIDSHSKDGEQTPLDYSRFEIDSAMGGMAPSMAGSVALSHKSNFTMLSMPTIMGNKKGAVGNLALPRVHELRE